MSNFVPQNIRGDIDAGNTLEPFVIFSRTVDDVETPIFAVGNYGTLVVDDTENFTVPCYGVLQKISSHKKSINLKSHKYKAGKINITIINDGQERLLAETDTQKFTKKDRFFTDMLTSNYMFDTELRHFGFLDNNEDGLDEITSNDLLDTSISFIGLKVDIIYASKSSFVNNQLNMNRCIFVTTCEVMEYKADTKTLDFFCETSMMLKLQKKIELQRIESDIESSNGKVLPIYLGDKVYRKCYGHKQIDDNIELLISDERYATLASNNPNDKLIYYAEEELQEIPRTTSELNPICNEIDDPLLNDFSDEMLNFPRKVFVLDERLNTAYTQWNATPNAIHFPYENQEGKLNLSNIDCFQVKITEIPNVSFNEDNEQAYDYPSFLPFPLYSSPYDIAHPTNGHIGNQVGTGFHYGFNIYMRAISGYFSNNNDTTMYYDWLNTIYNDRYNRFYIIRKIASILADESDNGLDGMLNADTNTITTFTSGTGLPVYQTSRSSFAGDMLSLKFHLKNRTNRPNTRFLVQVNLRSNIYADPVIGYLDDNLDPYVPNANHTGMSHGDGEEWKTWVNAYCTHTFTLKNKIKNSLSVDGGYYNAVEELLLKYKISEGEDGIGLSDFEDIESNVQGMEFSPILYGGTTEKFTENLAVEGQYLYRHGYDGDPNFSPFTKILEKEWTTTREVVDYDTGSTITIPSNDPNVGTSGEWNIANVFANDFYKKTDGTISPDELTSENFLQEWELNAYQSHNNWIGQADRPNYFIGDAKIGIKKLEYKIHYVVDKLLSNVDIYKLYRGYNMINVSDEYLYALAYYNYPSCQVMWLMKTFLNVDSSGDFTPTTSTDQSFSYLQNGQAYPQYQNVVIDEERSFLDLTSDILKNTQCYAYTAVNEPISVTDTKSTEIFKYFHIKDTYIGNEPNYNFVNVGNDFINVRASTTSRTDIVTAVTVNYASDTSDITGNLPNKTEKRTADEFYEDYKLDYYNFKEEVHLEINMPKISRQIEAEKYRDFYLKNNCNQKINLDIELPLKYIDTNLGDILFFDYLPNNQRINGYDYTVTHHVQMGAELNEPYYDPETGEYSNPEYQVPEHMRKRELLINGQYWLPFFMVHDITIGTKSIRLKAQQLMHLKSSSESPPQPCYGGVCHVPEEIVVPIAGCNLPFADNYNALVNVPTNDICEFAGDLHQVPPAYTDDNGILRAGWLDIEVKTTETGFAIPYENNTQTSIDFDTINDFTNACFHTSGVEFGHNSNYQVLAENIQHDQKTGRLQHKLKKYFQFPLIQHKVYYLNPIFLPDNTIGYDVMSKLDNIYNFTELKYFLSNNVQDPLNNYIQFVNFAPQQTLLELFTPLILPIYHFNGQNLGTHQGASSNDLYDSFDYDDQSVFRFSSQRPSDLVNFSIEWELFKHAEEVVQESANGDDDISIYKKYNQRLRELNAKMNFWLFNNNQNIYRRFAPNYEVNGNNKLLHQFCYSHRDNVDLPDNEIEYLNANNSKILTVSEYGTNKALDGLEYVNAWAEYAGQDNIQFGYHEMNDVFIDATNRLYSDDLEQNETNLNSGLAIKYVDINTVFNNEFGLDSSINEQYRIGDWNQGSTPLLAVQKRYFKNPAQASAVSRTRDFTNICTNVAGLAYPDFFNQNKSQIQDDLKISRTRAVNDVDDFRGLENTSDETSDIQFMRIWNFTTRPIDINLPSALYEKTFTSDDDPTDYGDFLAIEGDVNGDGQLNVLDVVQLVNHILGNVPLTGLGLQSADVNQDNIVDILDIVLLVNLVLES